MADASHDKRWSSGRTSTHRTNIDKADKPILGFCLRLAGVTPMYRKAII